MHLGSTAPNLTEYWLISPLCCVPLEDCVSWALLLECTLTTCSRWLQFWCVWPVTMGRLLFSLLCCAVSRSLPWGLGGVSRQLSTIGYQVLGVARRGFSLGCFFFFPGRIMVKFEVLFSFARVKMGSCVCQRQWFLHPFLPTSDFTQLLNENQVLLLLGLTNVTI